jgi:hypothetical protein
MDKDTLTKVKLVLRGREEIFFPVKELYNNHLLGPELPPMEELVAELKAQPDLVVTRNLGTRDENDPVVMLRERIPSLEDIIDRVRDSIGSTLENLTKAYDAGLPGMSREEEDQMLEALQRTKELRDEMERMFADARQRAANAADSGKDRS